MKRNLKKEARQIVTAWVQGLMPEDEAAKINVDNLDDFLPTDLYYHKEGTRYLNVMSPRWVYKQLKKGKSVKEIMSGLS
jgi:hypothetical protein